MIHKFELVNFHIPISNLEVPEFGDHQKGSHQTKFYSNQYLSLLPHPKCFYFTIACTCPFSISLWWSIPKIRFNQGVNCLFVPKLLRPSKMFVLNTLRLKHFQRKIRQDQISKDARPQFLKPALLLHEDFLDSMRSVLLSHSSFALQFSF